MKRIASALVAASAVFAGPAQAAELSGASYTIEIRGVVPTICRATFESAVVSAGPGETSLGALNEFCNSPNGYQVYVESSPELDGASLVVDGRTVALDGNAPVLVAASDRPNILSRNVSLSSPSGVSGSLSFRIVAR